MIKRKKMHQILLETAMTDSQSINGAVVSELADSQ
jgi:hypothetical protein